MFAPKKNTYVDNEISRLVLALQDKEVDSEEYGSILERLGKLHKVRQDEKPDRVSSDTIALITANLAGILLVIRHENVNVVTSKALSFILKAK
jgi:hypothetical protein